jgi:uncharacterized damage-inducible protein DinB
MHLAGNVRQWIVDGVGGQPVERDRAAEFATRAGPSAKELIDALDSAVMEADAVLSRLSADELVRRNTIQDREQTVLEAVYHVVEHFAMHTGQIVLLTKAYVPGAVRFYDDSTPMARPLWGGTERMR